MDEKDVAQITVYKSFNPKIQLYEYIDIVFVNSKGDEEEFQLKDLYYLHPEESIKHQAKEVSKVLYKECGIKYAPELINFEIEES